MSVGLVTEWSATRSPERAAGWLGRWLDIPLTIGVSLFALGAAFAPRMGGWLEFNRSAVMAGEWWRILTGHFVHWNLDHLMWDLLVFVVLSAMCERRNQMRFVVTLSAAAVLISAATWWLLPDVASYRGLSGLDTAIFALLAVSNLQECWQRRQWLGVAVVSGLVVALAAKIGFEAVTGGTWFVDASRGGFRPVPLAHVVGGLCGVVCALRLSEEKE